MIRWSTLPILLLLALPLCAQWSDNFSGMSLGDGLAWFGDTSDFTINMAGELQLNAETEGVSTIYTHFDINAESDFSWQWYTRLDFDPSASNAITIFLWLDTITSDQANGIFLSLGESGSEDSWSLYQLQQGTTILLARGTRSHGMNPEMHVIAKKLGNTLSISTQTSRDQSPVHELSAPIEMTLDSGYFGFRCSYTNSRRNLFYFDELNLFPGSNPPVMISSAKPIDDHHLSLSFSGPLQNEAGQNASFHFIPDLGPPVQIQHPATDTIIITTGSPMQPFQPYVLHINQLRDAEDRIIRDSVTFEYTPSTQLQPYQLLISEIYDDPTPSNGIPEVEYIELYLLPDAPTINLQGYQLYNDDRQMILPEFILPPDEWVIMCDDSKQEAMELYGQVVPLPQFQALVNSGNHLQIRNTEGTILHQVQYNDQWYRDQQKSNGGWSLELINPNTPCLLKDNWKASESMIGGTPGTVNSVWTPDADTSTGPVIVLQDVNPGLITLQSNVALSSTTDISDFLLEGGTSQITDLRISVEESGKLYLQVMPELDPQQSYVLSSESLRDCLEMPVVFTPVDMEIPKRAEPGDLIINEILFDPHVGGSDFIEIRNLTDHTIETDGLFLGNWQKNPADNVTLTGQTNFAPGSYRVFTRDPEDIKARYPVAQPDWLSIQDLPAWDNDQGNITLYLSGDHDPVIIDAFDYFDHYHISLLKDPEGVSLERVDSASPSQDPSTWHSASMEAGAATPTGPNSQQRQVHQPEGSFDLFPKSFSPDGDGFDDFLSISIQPPQPGFFGQVRIYDDAGRLVRQLRSNVSLGTDSTITWDGTTDEGQKAPIGIYLVHVQLFNQEGAATEWKETCVVAGNLD